jgi:alpha-L-rhamnosidase
MCDIEDAQQASGMVPTMAPEYFVYEKGFRDSVEWGGACALVPELMRRWYDDAAVVARMRPVVDRYLAHLATQAKDGILATGLGDWDGYGPDKRTPVAVTDTAYYALLLGERGAAVRRAFLERFFDATTGRVATGSQSCQATALDLGLVPKEHEEKAFAQLVADVEAQGRAISCGEVGHPSLLRVLMEHGRSDLIWAIHHQSARPGYGWQLARGATTLTEAWDASPISQNHFMLGHILEWFYAGLAGIRVPAHGGAFKSFVIAPVFLEQLDWVRASYRSVRGTIASEWKRKGKEITVRVRVPPGTSATLRLPDRVINLVPGTKSITFTARDRASAASPRR